MTNLADDLLLPGVKALHLSLKPLANILRISDTKKIVSRQTINYLCKRDVPKWLSLLYRPQSIHFSKSINGRYTMHYCTGQHTLHRQKKRSAWPIFL